MNLPRRRNLTPSQAAAHLGVSAKALRLYEEAGLLAPGRSSAGWRIYSPEDLDGASTIASLRALGLSLAQVGRAIAGDSGALEVGLAAHEARLRRQSQHIDTALLRLGKLRDEIRRGRQLDAAALDLILGSSAAICASFQLPWPWAGEWFEARDIGPLNFITGPLGSGKTRFAERLAAELPAATFLGLDRLQDESVTRRLEQDAALAEHVASALDWLEEEGADRTDALLALVVALEADAPTTLVIEMAEEGLSERTQRALMAWLRLGASHERTTFLLTRSSAILDVDLAGAEEGVFYCPANHSPPFRAKVYPGGHGYEAVATCVATPEARARTAGILAIRSGAAG